MRLSCALALAALFASTALTSCAAPPAPVSRGPIQGALERAADLEGVPRPLLLALAWVDSRWSMNEGKPGNDSAYGLLHLVDRPDAPAVQSLSRAAALTGLSPEALRTDAFANARGGAALLRAEAEQVFAGYKDLDQDLLGDWYLVVMRAAGVTNARLADDYAAQVYRVLRDGVIAQQPQETLRLAPQQFEIAGRAIWGALEQDLGGDYCPSGTCVAFVPAASGNYSTVRDEPVTMIIIHDMEGTYSSTISWFQNPASGVSAHYDVRSSDGQITQQVSDANTAWHAGNHAVNNGSIGIEHEGYAHQGATWYTEAMYQSSAALARWIADQYKIPKDRAHIIGHYEVPDTSHAGWYGGASNHHDPCDTWAGNPTWHNNTACYWNWDHYMALVTGGGGPPPANGTLTGFIGDACCGIAAATRKPLAGAVVKLSGTSYTATADSSGTYSFSLPAATYTPVANSSGYQPGDHTSIGPGYPAALNVTANATIYGSIVLTRTPPAPVAPQVRFASPAEGATVAATPVTVTGTLDDTAVTSVSIAGQAFPASGGHFSGTAALTPGANTIVASATNSGGTGSATLHLTLKLPPTGLTGTVSDVSGPVAAVQITLRPGGAQAVSASDGSYTLAAVPGSYTLATDLAGYQPLSQPVTIPAGGLLSLDLSLAASQEPVTQPALRIDEPLDGATVTVSSVTVSGVVALPAPVALSVQGEAAQVDPAGRFSAQVTLLPGANDVTIKAQGKAGAAVVQHLAILYDPPPAAAAKTGCASAGSAQLLALLPALALALRRRRRRA